MASLCPPTLGWALSRRGVPLWMQTRRLGPLNGLATKVPQMTQPMRGHSNQCVGIRKETKGRWERRAPLAPEQVKVLTSQGVRVLIQPSNLRVFADIEYQRAGAEVTNDLTPAATILGVKEVPEGYLLEGKTYFFFSHTHKAQEYNMGMLDAIVDKRVRLIDYERMVDAKGHRIVLFGKFAGIAGMTKLINGLGNRLLGMGYHTPLVYMGQAHNYQDLATLKKAVNQLGKQLAVNGAPLPLQPLSVVFTGDGNVSKGAQEIFQELPHKWITVEQMRDFVLHQNFDRHIAYGTVVQPQDYMERISGNRDTPFDKKHYYAHPEEYRSVFHSQILPYASAIVNCMYWDRQYPRIITNHQMRDAAVNNRHRLIGLGDITADPTGSIEFMSECTTIEDPFVLYNPITGESHRDMTGDGVLIMSVDNLPAELPLEATSYFGKMLLPYIEHYLKDPQLTSDHEMSTVLRKACITADGALTPKYSYIADLRKSNEAQKRHVLLLGSGMVAGPTVDYLAKYSDVRITIASLMKEEALQLSRGHDNVSTITADVSTMSDQALKELVGGFQVTVSLLPAFLHGRVADACVATGKHMVTASYVSPEMMALHERAAQAGVILFNEIGLDPGIDHLSAVKLIDDARAEGGVITSFQSWCGGLPAPEISDNALGYKFSWSPKSALLAGLNSATFRYKGEAVSIPAGRLYDHVGIIPVDHDMKGYSLEGLPNRDAMAVTKHYNLDDAATLFRGTLRYAGYSKVLKALTDLGLMNTKDVPYLTPGISSLSWRDLMTTVVPMATDSVLENAVVDQLQCTTDGDRLTILTALESLGILSSGQPVNPKGNMLDTLCDLLTKKLSYKPGERDMVIMRHLLDVEYPDRPKVTKSSTMVSYGAPHGEGYSAMATTVGIPVAIATRMILDGGVKQRGVVVPVTKDLYEPMLWLLEQQGIVHKEETRVHTKRFERATDTGDSRSVHGQNHLGRVKL